MTEVRTRIAPSPTGMMHLGTARTAIYCWAVARHFGGKFLLRIEDTDQERSTPEATQVILDSMKWLNLDYDNQGAVVYQMQRLDRYKEVADSLLEKGFAYWDYCSKEELDAMREAQKLRGEKPRYDGRWRPERAAELGLVKPEGVKPVLRFRNPDDGDVTWEDAVYGPITVSNTELDDLVIMRSDGIPTYHFAHVVDDHLMGTTVVVRGEEWLATLPVHLQLFRAMGWKAPKYAHTAQLMKIDPETGGKRKLSKRKDPELALTFYAQEGYPVPAVLEYLMTLLNSNFEEWRRANPDLPMNDFPFTTKKMSGSGALFDIEKLRDVSKNVISRMTAEQVYDYVAEWSAVNDKEFNALLTRDPAFSKAYLAIGRGGKKPRKDLALWSDAKGYMDFMFDELFQPDYTMPERVSAEDAKAILSDFAGMFDENDTPDGFFDKMKQIASAHGYAADTKAYKADPSAFKGAVGDVSMVVRVAIAGRQNAPDLQTVMGILGREKVLDRLEKCSAAL